MKRSIILNQYAGLDYVTITHLPVIQIGNDYTKNEIRTVSKINEAVAKAILKKNLLIRGRELKFLRVETLQLTLEKFSRALLITASSIHHWEKDPNQPLHPINELAVRALIAEQLGLKLRLRIRSANENSESAENKKSEKIRINAKNLVKFNEVERGPTPHFPRYDY